MSRKITGPSKRSASKTVVVGAASPQQPRRPPPESVAGMGPLELAAYKVDWRASWRYRRHAAEVSAARDHTLRVKQLEIEALVATDRARRAACPKAERRAAIARLRQIGKAIEQSQGADRPRSFPPTGPVIPATVSARLLFARLFDSRPNLWEAIRSAAPVVIIEISDPEFYNPVVSAWQAILFADPRRVLRVGHDSIGKRADCDAVCIAVGEPPIARHRGTNETEALAALSLALPMIAISPAPETHLPSAVLRAAQERLTLPRLDPTAVARAIRIVTGKRCRDLLDEATVARVTPSDLIIAIRFDRTPAECMAELRRLAGDEAARKGGRDISLDELYGMDEAVAWARSTICDLEAWRRGEIAWSALDSGACLVGPPGTGKTLLAQCFSRAAGLPMIACSLAQWQSTDEGHLGHLLRAMRRDFDSARSRTPCVMFIDEIDSFADRSKVRHSHADYVVEVVNGFIAQLDGVADREGLIFLAASNDVSRCDPAILRSGRLNRIIRIGLPNVEQLERMFRVRLGQQLGGEDLSEICLLALGSTGADVERITKDAARFARHQNRQMQLGDLRRALVDVEERAPREVARAAGHEAGHILMEILLFGEPENLHANVATSDGRGGATMRTKTPPFAGTYADYHHRLQILLAGRTAEEMLFGDASHGAGGRRGSDLQQATAFAAAMVASLGLAGPRHLLFLAPAEDTDELLAYADVRATAHSELEKAAQACRATLMMHNAALGEISASLLLTGRIDGVTAAAIIDAHREAMGA
ncbi:AAA family ATPase [uncultured Bradyrhizobium sp.]|uniref:ATP-binding protein n=1 Tax=Bradyrhizobium sp. TaxID=376 RepID=UPI00262D619C|nr:AAA family ATPase [uncultured Bradyrhizobium sp.]